MFVFFKLLTFLCPLILLHPSLLFYSPTGPSLHVCLLVLVVVVAVQVGNMNYLAGRQCSAWKTAVSMVRMDEERQERDETDSSSQPSSIHPSIHPPLPLTHPCTMPPLKSLGFFPLREGTKRSLPPLFQLKIE